MGNWAHHWLYQDFWALIWPNAGAMPLCALVAFAGGWIFRDRIGRSLVRWWHKHRQAHLAELAARRNDEH